MYTYKIHLHKEDTGFTVIVPALQGCITYGENIDEAIAMAKEAIELYTSNSKTRINTQIIQFNSFNQIIY